MNAPKEMRIVADERVEVRDGNLVEASVFEHDTVILTARARLSGMHAQIQMSKDDARNFAHAILRSLDAAESDKGLPPDPYFILWRLRGALAEALDGDAFNDLRTAYAFCRRVEKMLEESRGAQVTGRDAASNTRIAANDQGVASNRGEERNATPRNDAAIPSDLPQSAAQNDELSNGHSDEGCCASARGGVL